MSYFFEVSEFGKNYRLGIIDRAIMFGLYPIFKLHHWFYYGSNLKKVLARLVFNLLPKNKCLNIDCYSVSLRRNFKLPVWLVPDHLTSLREIFWTQAYKLESSWTPTSLIDAGANVGYASLYLATQYGIKKILAIEANSNLIPKLQYVTKILIDFGIDIRIANGALVGRTRKLAFEVCENSRDSSFGNATKMGTKTMTVDGYRLNDWRNRLNFSEMDFEKNRLFKIDIEGAEFEVLEEDREAFSGAQYLIAEVHGETLIRNQFAVSLSSTFNIDKRIITPACETVEVLYASN